MGKAWKAFERWIARKVFGTERNALSGGSNRNDDGTARRGDVIDQTGVLMVECKNYKSPTINNWMEEAEKDANGDKAPLVFVHKKHRDYMNSTVTLRLADFLLIKKEFIEAMRDKYGEEDDGGNGGGGAE